MRYRQLRSLHYVFPAEEGYMLLGEEKRYDAGLDNVLERMYCGWFCDKCKKAVKIDEKHV